MDSDPPPRSTNHPAEIGDEPYSSGILFHTAAPLIGVVIALCTLVVPLVSVISDRRPVPAATSPATAH